MSFLIPPARQSKPRPGKGCKWVNMGVGALYPVFEKHKLAPLSTRLVGLVLDPFGPFQTICLCFVPPKWHGLAFAVTLKQGPAKTCSFSTVGHPAMTEGRAQIWLSGPSRGTLGCLRRLRTRCVTTALLLRLLSPDFASEYYMYFIQSVYSESLSNRCLFQMHLYIQ